MSDKATIQVSLWAESEKSYGVLVDLIFDENGRNTSGSRLEWFPKKLCELERVEPKDVKKDHPKYFLTAPVWLLEKNKCFTEKTI